MVGWFEGLVGFIWLEGCSLDEGEGEADEEEGEGEEEDGHQKDFIFIFIFISIPHPCQRTPSPPISSATLPWPPSKQASAQTVEN